MEALQKAIDIFIKATEQDKAKKYSQALNLYELGLRYVEDYIKDEGSTDISKEAVQTKCIQYSERAKKLKSFLEDTGQQSGSSDHGHREAEKQKLRDKLSDAIVIEKPDVHWEDVAGLEDAKKVLQDAISVRSSGEIMPFKSILLYGPPGTGKTHLAKALASEANNSTFFSVSSSDLVSKWLGESEATVRNLFNLAREGQSSIIFIDCIESMCGYRSGNESNAVRSIKQELVMQMQDKCKENDGILVLAATDVPWTLDSAIRLGFEKRIFIPLPDAPSRLAILKHCLMNVPHTLTSDDLERLADSMEGYAGSDINVLVRDAIMMPVRKLQYATHFKKVQGPSRSDPTVMVDDLLTPCSPGDPGAVEMNWTTVPSDKLLEPTVSMIDMLKSLERAKPTVNDEDLKKLRKFTEDFGQEG